MKSFGTAQGLKVALVHDDLVQWGGAERVLVALSEIFPEAPIYTLFYDKENKILRKQLTGKKIITSFLQKIPGWKKLYKVLLPLHPIAFEQFDFSGFDLVISQTTRFAKVIITKPGTTHLCYCHTPPRFLWGFSDEREVGCLSFWGYIRFLRRYDKITSRKVDLFIAGSKNAQQRIREVYDIDSKVIYPFVDPERFKNLKSFDGGYLLVVARLNRYKRVDLAVRAANKLRIPLKVVGVGPEFANLKKIAGDTVEFLGKLDEATLNIVLAGCKALVVAGEEDFGLTPLEAQALGKPVIAFAKGGVLETVVNRETGYFFTEQTVDSLISALVDLEKYGYNRSRLHRFAHETKCCKQSFQQQSLKVGQGPTYNKVACLKQAQKFSKEVFIQKFQNLASSL